MHKRYVKEINLESNRHHIEDIFDMLMCNARDTDEDLYDHIESLLYEMAYGKRINDEMAFEWVENMKPLGEHWTIEETTNVKHQYGVGHEDIEFYVVANMMYNDFYKLIKDNENFAIEMAIEWLNDKDAKECKLYEYWKNVIKK